jgi:hypothetical protein
MNYATLINTIQTLVCKEYPQLASIKVRKINDNIPYITGYRPIDMEYFFYSHDFFDAFNNSPKRRLPYLNSIIFVPRWNAIKNIFNNQIQLYVIASGMAKTLKLPELAVTPQIAACYGLLHEYGIALEAYGTPLYTYIQRTPEIGAYFEAINDYHHNPFDFRLLLKVQDLFDSLPRERFANDFAKNFLKRHDTLAISLGLFHLEKL